MTEPTQESRIALGTSIHLHQSLNGQVMMSAMESRKASLLVQYFEDLKPVDESEVLVVPI